MATRPSLVALWGRRGGCPRLCRQRTRATSARAGPPGRRAGRVRASRPRCPPSPLGALPARAAAVSCLPRRGVPAAGVARLCHLPSTPPQRPPQPAAGCACSPLGGGRLAPGHFLRLRCLCRRLQPRTQPRARVPSASSGNAVSTQRTPGPADGSAPCFPTLQVADPACESVTFTEVAGVVGCYAHSRSCSCTHTCV